MMIKKRDLKPALVKTDKGVLKAAKTAGHVVLRFRIGTLSKFIRVTTLQTTFC